MRFSTLILCAIILITVSARWIAPHDPMMTRTDDSLQPPSLAYPLGTDLLGRDVFSRVLYGGQRTITIAFAAVLVAILPSVPILFIQQAGTNADTLLTTLLNVLLAIPPLMLSLVLITVLGRGWWQIALATGVAQIAPYARVVRGVSLQTYRMAYVDGARAVGGSKPWIVTRHILPNCLPTLLAYAGVMFSYAIINSAALSFLGLGGAPGTPEWGAILAEGRLVVQDAPWVSIAPGVLIVLTVIAVNTWVDQFVSIERLQ